ncbi:peptide/nickel transport system permease protein [Georgenia soli]|uniref:Peptide/nickel transport system permease protein n=1 Tax=Georgenia soli TaxID=638953 RepID=A0A2A9EPF7_9MICO|nr:ABC transporter permease [Georgenia soli]PFG40486.1 peptide/nickel transport system permease protein [Georgenia soli]
MTTPDLEPVAVDPAEGAPAAGPAGTGATGAGRRRRRRSPTLVIGLVLLAVVTAVALVSLVWLPYELSDTSGGRLEPPGPQHWLGTDTLGRDLFSQTMVGTRIALTVGLGATAVAIVIGVLVGVLAALTPPWLDDTVASALDILIAFPTLLLAMLVVAAQGSSMWTVVLAIGIGSSAIAARFTRILSRRVLAQQYVTAARTSGTGTLGLVVRHVLPNIWPSLVVNVAVLFGVAVLAEASLSYLGLGVPPPNASLGRLLQEAQGTVTTAPWAAIAPGLVIVAMVLGANFLADGLRDRFDPARRGNR